jgi:hypothetical protein
MRALGARIDEADVRQLAELVARLSPAQQRASDLSDEHVLGEAMTWLARRRQAAGDRPDPG